jgi:hypothetical protein
MAVTTLSQALHDALIRYGRTGVGTSPSATLRSGLVSDLADGDFLWGVRATVNGTPTVSGANHIVALRRRGALDFTVTWPSGSTVWFTRP